MHHIYFMQDFGQTQCGYLPLARQVQLNQSWDLFLLEMQRRQQNVAHLGSAIFGLQNDFMERIFACGHHDRKYLHQLAKAAITS